LRCRPVGPWVACVTKLNGNFTGITPHNKRCVKERYKFCKGAVRKCRSTGFEKCWVWRSWRTLKCSVPRTPQRVAWVPVATVSFLKTSRHCKCQCVSLCHNRVRLAGNDEPAHELCRRRNLLVHALLTRMEIAQALDVFVTALLGGRSQSPSATSVEPLFVRHLLHSTRNFDTTAKCRLGF
jgi:hypothetical protein